MQSNNDFKNIAGTLRVFGDWFGKPMDNVHSVKSFEEKDNYIRLVFDDDESLEVWDGRGIKITQDKLTINKASRVRWEWFCYGKPKTAENRFFIEHIVKDDKVIASSNVNWYSQVFNPLLKEPAVNIL